MGDISSGMSSSIMQLYLKQVLEAFFHTQSSVRHFALNVIALTLNQGLIHPVQVWQAFMMEGFVIQVFRGFHICYMNFQFFFSTYVTVIFYCSKRALQKANFCVLCCWANKRDSKCCIFWFWIKMPSHCLKSTYKCTLEHISVTSFRYMPGVFLIWFFILEYVSSCLHLSPLVVQTLWNSTVNVRTSVIISIILCLHSVFVTIFYTASIVYVQSEVVVWVFLNGNFCTQN